MEIVDSVRQMRHIMDSYHTKAQRVALVPTMGALHAGHLSLLDVVRNSVDQVICTIFVNPAQFNEKEDFMRYPRPLKADIRTLKEHGECDVLFLPKAKEMYAHTPRIQISFPALTHHMEGASRPGHFEGVALILSKLLHMLSPQVLVMGEKDWQQCVVTQTLIDELAFNTTLHIAPTYRSEQGLAYSSRNQLLSAKAYEVAPKFYQSLRVAAQDLTRHENLSSCKAALQASLSHTNMFKLDYFSIVDSYTLQPITTLSSHKYVSLCAAAHIEKIRLLDHIRIVRN